MCVHCIYNVHTFAILYIQIGFGLCSGVVYKQMHDRILENQMSQTYRHATLPPVGFVCCTHKWNNKQQGDRLPTFATQLKCEIWIFIGKHHRKHKHKNAINILGIHLDVIAFVCNRLNFFFFNSFFGCPYAFFVVQSFCLHLRLHHTMYTFCTTNTHTHAYQMCTEQRSLRLWIEFMTMSSIKKNRKLNYTRMLKSILDACILGDHCDDFEYEWETNKNKSQ